MRLLRILPGLLVLLALLPGTAYAARSGSQERPKAAAPHVKAKAKGTKKPQPAPRAKNKAKPHAKATKAPRAARKKTS